MIIVTKGTLMEPFYALSRTTSPVNNNFDTQVEIQHYLTSLTSKASVATCEASTRVADNLCTEKKFFHFASALSAKFHCSTPPIGSLAPRRRICQTLKPPTPRRPCPIFLKMVVSGEPPLTCDPSCGRRVGRKNLQQVPPDEA